MERCSRYSSARARTGSLSAFGAPEQALYSAIKLPALVLTLVLATTAVNAMLALLLRAPIGLRQSAVCILLGLATTAIILGALSPVATFVALSAPPPDPTVLGLSLEHPRAAAANRAAQMLLLLHVCTIAAAGVLGNLRLFSLLRRLGGRREIALRVLVAWLSVELLVGSQLSWLFRPFLGRPHRTPELISDVMFQGSFFEEIADAAVHTLGVQTLAAVGIFVVFLAAIAWIWGRSDGTVGAVDAQADGLRVKTDDASFFVAWQDVFEVTARPCTVFFTPAFELVFDVGGAPVRRILARSEHALARDELAERVAHYRCRPRGPGPFRRAAGYRERARAPEPRIEPCISAEGEAP